MAKRKSFTTSLDDDLQNKFKAACAINGVKMNDVLEAFMRGYINNEFKLEISLKQSGEED